MKRFTAFYDFEVSPASWDFMFFLGNVEIVSRNLGLSPHIVFVPAKNETGFRIDTKPISRSDKEWRLYNLLAPLCHVIMASYTIASSREHAQEYMSGKIWPLNYTVEEPKACYGYKFFREMVAIYGVPKFSVFNGLEHLVPQEPYVTITLRDTYGDVRNSNLHAWSMFTTDLLRSGYHVVKIPDTAKAAHHADGLGAIAAFNPLVRHALYANATMNLGVANGPLSLCYLTDLPYMQFKLISDYYSTTEEAWRKSGYPVGGQNPWSNAKQKLVWKDDEYEVLNSEFFEMMSERKAA